MIVHFPSAFSRECTGREGAMIETQLVKLMVMTVKSFICRKFFRTFITVPLGGGLVRLGQMLNKKATKVMD